MQKSSKIIIIVVSLLVIGGIIFFESTQYPEIKYTTIANTSIGTVEVGIAGNENATKCIALITGIHPRETLSIDPEIQSAREFANDNVKIINYKVTVTENPEDYEQGRANGESLVHDYVNPNVTASDADAVIISHSHNPKQRLQLLSCNRKRNLQIHICGFSFKTYCTGRLSYICI